MPLSERVYSFMNFVSKDVPNSSNNSAFLRQKTNGLPVNGVWVSSFP